MDDPKKEKPPRFTNIGKHSLIAVSLFFLDAYVMNQGIISMFILLIAVVSAGILLFELIFKKEKAVVKKRLVVAAIYVCMALLVGVANGQNNKLAVKRANTVIAACEAYKGKHGAYPAKLDDLVPEFLPEVPQPKITLSSSKFYYHVVDGKHQLMYILLPPFGRPIYHFESKKWSYLD